ncbi:hypothetical protein ACFV1L_06080 [Kitasatospora sp. NPDC059646]|uniref:hypothetical protein n=1 Tax=Kitasatospora sp. NPDC059646 TaxID=3346893 RepID=UPI0036930F68
MIRQHPEELEADLMEFFGLDLLDVWRGRLSLRRIHVCVLSLMAKPGRSTLLAAMDESTRWGSAEYLLARVSDAMELNNYLFLKANSEKADDLPLPVPLPRPGEPEAETPELEFASSAELSDFFAQMSSL